MVNCLMSDVIFGELCPGIPVCLFNWWWIRCLASNPHHDVRVTKEWRKECKMVWRAWTSCLCKARLQSYVHESQARNGCAKSNYHMYILYCIIFRLRSMFVVPVEKTKMRGTVNVQKLLSLIMKCHSSWCFRFKLCPFQGSSLSHRLFFLRIL